MQCKLFRQFVETEFTKEIQNGLDNTSEFNWDTHKKIAKYGMVTASLTLIAAAAIGRPHTAG